jgi:hypothetical protein
MRASPCPLICALSMVCDRPVSAHVVRNGMGCRACYRSLGLERGNARVDTDRMDQTRLARRRDLTIALAELRALDAESRAAPRGSKQRIALEAPIEASQRKVRPVASEP